MASTVTKKNANVKSDQKVKQGMSWKRFFITSSVVLNIAFIVLIITMMTTNALDTLFIREGLSRYCSTTNDWLFTNNSEKLVAFRNYTCGTGNAQTYFENGFSEYLQSIGIEE